MLIIAISSFGEHLFCQPHIIIGMVAIWRIQTCMLLYFCFITIFKLVPSSWLKWKFPCALSVFFFIPLVTKQSQVRMLDICSMLFSSFCDTQSHGRWSSHQNLLRKSRNNSVDSQICWSFTGVFDGQHLDYPYAPDASISWHFCNLYHTIGVNTVKSATEDIGHNGVWVGSLNLIIWNQYMIFFFFFESHPCHFERAILVA